MTAIELFIVCLTQLDKLNPQSPGSYELVIRNRCIYAQHKEDHQAKDILILQYYKHVNRPRFTTAQWMELWDTLELYQKEGML